MTPMIDRRAILAGFAAATLTGIPSIALTANQILEATDRLRNPQQPFRSTISITEYVAARKSDAMKITVYSKPRPNDGQFRSLVYIDSPRKDRGKLMLRDGKDLYFYDPDAANTIRISPQQRLLGQASNGDVMTTNFSRDYSAILVGTKVIKDASGKDRECHALKMKARTNAAVYGSVEYWVDAKSMHPVKGRFYSRSGKLLKIAFYDVFRSILGALRPTKVLIIDALNKKNVTIMKFGNFASVDLPDARFQKSYLPKFQKQ